jgi:hypothetical protein
VERGFMDDGEVRHGVRAGEYALPRHAELGVSVGALGVAFRGFEHGAGVLLGLEHSGDDQWLVRAQRRRT